MSFDENNIASEESGIAVLGNLRADSQDEVKEILGHPPSWILKWGITLALIILGGMVALSFFIKFPDVMEAELVLTSANPPIVIYAEASGKVKRLVVKDQEQIEQGDLILVIASLANRNDVEVAIAELEELEKLSDDYKILSKFKFKKELQLGKIQYAYSQLQSEFATFRKVLRESIVFKQMDHIDGEIRQTEKLIASIQRQIEIHAREVELELSNYQRMQRMLADGLTSAVDFENVEKAYFLAKRNHEQLKMSMTNNELAIERMLANKLKLKANRRSAISDLEIALSEKIKIVKEEIAQWKKQYLVVAPVSGKVNYLDIRSENEFVQQLDPLVTIVQGGQNSIVPSGIIARAQVDEMDSGKIQIGNEVNIHFGSFPAKEFGIVKSRISSISLIPSADVNGVQKYTMDIPLEHPLITTYDRKIPFKPNQSGIAKIITEDKSIADRIFETFFNLLKNK